MCSPVRVSRIDEEEQKLICECTLENRLTGAESNVESGARNQQSAYSIGNNDIQSTERGCCVFDYSHAI